MGGEISNKELNRRIKSSTSYAEGLCIEKCGDDEIFPMELYGKMRLHEFNVYDIRKAFMDGIKWFEGSIMEDKELDRVCDEEFDRVLSYNSDSLDEDMRKMFREGFLFGIKSAFGKI